MLPTYLPTPPYPPYPPRTLRVVVVQAGSLKQFLLYYYYYYIKVFFIDFSSKVRFKNYFGIRSQWTYWTGVWHRRSHSLIFFFFFKRLYYSHIYWFVNHLMGFPKYSLLGARIRLLVEIKFAFKIYLKPLFVFWTDLVVIFTKLSKTIKNFRLFFLIYSSHVYLKKRWHRQRI